MPPRAIEFGAAFLLACGCVVGGSSAPGRVLPVAAQLASLPLLLMVVDRGSGVDRSPGRLRYWIAAIILALPVAQLIPLPAPVWASLPGRASVAEAYGAAGLALPWLPVSLTPGETERMALAILPALVLALAVPLLPQDARRRLIHLAIALGVLDAVLGFAQVAGGPNSPLRFYDTASRSDAVGFFANRNHHAIFMALPLVLVGALFADRQGGRGEKVWLGSAAALLLLGIASAGSRAGLLLGLGGSLAGVWCVLSSRVAALGKHTLVFWGTLAVLPFLLGLGIFGTSLLRVQPESVTGDLRWQIARTTWRAILDTFPVGSGFGSFERVYARFERPDEIISSVINNAHDDWLELILEGGLPALLLLLAAVAFLVRDTVRRDPDPGRPSFDRAIRTATLAMLWLCALHSLVDYPLRSPAVSLVLALACGLRLATVSPRRRLTGTGPAMARHAVAAPG